MSLEKLETARGVQSEWNKMHVGPILDRDRPSRYQDSICRVSQSIFYNGPTTPSKGLEQGVTATSLISSSSPQESSPPRRVQSVEVRSSPFYFGSANAVIERDEKNSKYWVRLQNSVTDGIDWVKLDCGKLYM